MSSPLYDDQLNRARLPKRFMAQMPYITYFSICDGDKCDLLFAYLSLDHEDYFDDLEKFANHNDFKKFLEILIYAHSDCCILRKNIPKHWDHSIKGMVNFYR